MNVESAEAPVVEAPPVPPGPRRSRWVMLGVVVALAGLGAFAVFALRGSDSAAKPAAKPAEQTTFAVSENYCGKGFNALGPGRQTFHLRNAGTTITEVYLIDPAGGAIYGEVENIAPGTVRNLTATVGRGTYALQCFPKGGKAITSPSVQVNSGPVVGAVSPVSEVDFEQPLAQYRAYVMKGLAKLVTQAGQLRDDVRNGDLDAARRDWLTAHLTYASLGAAYGTFEDFDGKINGRPDGLAKGAQDPEFTGFLRVEYGLWHNESAKQLAYYTNQLALDVAGLRKAFPKQEFDVADLPLRTHEILENTLEFELTARTDQGSGTNLATAQANLAGTQELLRVLHGLISVRSSQLVATVDRDVQRLGAQLAAMRTRGGEWTPVEKLGVAARARLNGATSQLLEDLAPIPDLLEIKTSA